MSSTLIAEAEPDAPTPDGAGDEGGDGAGGDESPSDGLSADETFDAPQEPSSTQTGEAVAKKLDAENTRHGKTLARLMGVAVDDLTECPKCETYGYLPPGAGEAPTLLHDPEMTRCERCDGYGLTLTGAQPEAEGTYNCSRCGGRGWINTPPETPAYTPEAAAAPIPPVPVAPPGYVLVPVSP